MSRFFVFALTLMLGLAFVMDQAEARRFGAGKSLGRSYSFSRPKPARPYSTPRNAQAANPVGGRPRSGLSRWLGPLAGLAAGGLLASLFFGDHFQGLQIMDLLIFAGLAFGAFALFRAWRQRSAGPVPAGGPGLGTGGHPAAPPLSLGAGETLGTEGPTDLGEAPPWFDAQGFLAGAKGHFSALQAAWDRGDLDEIRTYVTPELYTELARERAALGGPQHTEVLTLDAELVGLERDGDQVVASILFKALVREQAEGEATEVSEVWHVVHPWDRPEGDWLIAGIRPLD